MIIGNPSRFALESSITNAYSELGLRALGLFVIHIRSIRYGVYAPDATMLACSLDEVKERLQARGHHTAPFVSEPDPGKIANAYRHAIYAPNQESGRFLGLNYSEFRRCIYEKQLVWAPDGDEAFDDGSFVLQFDDDDKVRLIAFKTSAADYAHKPETLVDLWIGAEEFYSLLEQWSNAFETEWRDTLKAHGS